jgi:hypothetical protein
VANRKEEMEKTYLGDGLYVEHDGYQLELSTLEGQRVYLDSQVWTALVAYVQRIQGAQPDGQ